MDLLDQRKRLKEEIKQGNVTSLLTYLKMKEQESTEKLILQASNGDFHRAQVLTFREVITLLTK